jgi:hypothetical protein
VADAIPAPDRADRTAPPAPAAARDGRRRAGGGTRARWRAWRRSRPFWGGLLVLLSGAEILVTMRAPLPVILHIGMQGVAGLVIPAVEALCGLLLWFNPAQRLFYSLVAVLLTLATWVTSNLGGFVIGILLGLVGASLAFAWTPIRPPAPAPGAAAPPYGPGERDAAVGPDDRPLTTDDPDARSYDGF